MRRYFLQRKPFEPSWQINGDTEPTAVINVLRSLRHAFKMGGVTWNLPPGTGIDRVVDQALAGNTQHFFKLMWCGKPIPFRVSAVIRTKGDNYFHSKA